MTLPRRLAVAGSAGILASVLYIAALILAPSIVRHVVEETLVQKLPGEIPPERALARFRSALSAAHGREAQLRVLLRVSQYLEKQQKLSSQDVDWIFQSMEPGPSGQD